MDGQAGGQTDHVDIPTDMLEDIYIEQSPCYTYKFPDNLIAFVWIEGIAGEI